MANKSFSQLTEDTNPAVNDIVATTDVSDTTDSANGTSKFVTLANLSKALSPEATNILSTGETGGTKFLREDGDNTCSFQAVPLSGLTGTAWRVFYTDGSGILTELALGASGTILQSNGASAAPTFETAGAGDVIKVGTPADSQIAVWTGDGTVEGTSDLTYDGANLQLTGDIGSTGTRITKGWFTDLQVTNAIAGSITGNAATVTTITGLAPDTATTQATQPNITTCANLTTVGALNAGSITSGFGNIDIGSSTFDTTGAVSTGQLSPSSVLIDIAPADTEYSGYVINDTLGEAVSAGDVLYQNADGTWYMARNDVEAEASGLIGIACAAGSGAGNIDILLKGTFRHDTNYAFATIGAKLYVPDTDGVPSATATTTTGEFVRLIGWVVAADTIMVDVSAYHIEIA